LFVQERILKENPSERVFLKRVLFPIFFHEKENGAAGGIHRLETPGIGKRNAPPEAFLYSFSTNFQYSPLRANQRFAKVPDG